MRTSLRSRRAKAHWFALCAFALLCGCAWAVADVPLERWTEATNARFIAQIPDHRSDDLLVFLAFSGGGTRAAALAYGVLEELRATQIQVDGKPRRLLDEVDAISSVSGGSFTAAYYGLFGDRIFEDFEARFLRKDIEGALLEELLLPPNWFRLGSGAFGTSDLAAEYYDEHLFDHATFRDFYRPTAPAVVINATDLASGSRFGFTQLFFDLLCADLDEYPVARGVAASSAVPLLLSPITLRNYTPQCGYKPPAWLLAAEHDASNPRRREQARNRLAYMDSAKRKYVHLVDGGIADNLGLRAAFQLVSLEGNTEATFKYLGHPRPRLILFILVNAASHPEPSFVESAISPSLGELIHAVTSDQINRFSFETIELVTTAFQSFAKQLASRTHPVQFNFVEVSLEAVHGKAERQFLNDIGTSFSLTNEQVDRLIGTGRSVLRASQQYQEALDLLRGGAHGTVRPVSPARRQSPEKRGAGSAP